MPIPDLRIEPVQEDQISLLRVLAERTFIRAFGHHNKPENMRQYLAAAFTPEVFQQKFATPGIIFYLAWRENEAIGYLQLNTEAAQNEHLLANALEIERIYVRADQQGLGIGQQLLEFAIKRARAQNKTWIWLGVWDQNTAAIRFYERHGFTQFSQHEFYLGSDRQLDFLLKKKIT